MKIALVTILLCMHSVVAFSSTDSLFPVPANLVDNIKFWKIIYTEVSTKEGLIHDRDYPLVIYDKVFIGTLYGKKLDDFTGEIKKKIAVSIKKVQSTDRATWGAAERNIALLFKSLPAGALSDAENRIRFQVGQRERFIDGLKRSGALIDTIRTILSKHAIPLRLAYLPHVESSFDYSAYSHAGAAGIWQFMPETGKEYLRVTRYIDERRDPILSTVAAARLLGRNFAQLKSWPLAITAYNYGLSGVMNAVKSLGTRDLGIITSKHESPSFRFASKNFYSCFIAASDIAMHAERYFGQLEYMPKINPGNEITLNVQLYTFEISRMLGITEDEIAEMNPSILPHVFKKQIPLPEGTKIRIKGLLVQKTVEKQIASFLKEYPKSQKRILRNKTIPFTIIGQVDTHDKDQLLVSRNKTLADSIYNIKSEWPEKRYLKFFNDILNGNTGTHPSFGIAIEKNASQDSMVIYRRE